MFQTALWLQLYDPTLPYAHQIGNKTLQCGDTLCDAVYVDLASEREFGQLSNRTITTSATMQNDGVMLVKRTRSALGDWRLFAPFATDLWGALLGIVVLTASALLLLFLMVCMRILDGPIILRHRHTHATIL